MEKTFKHDCPSCTFLGSVLVGVKRYDAYVHTAEPTSLIARFGDDDPDYMSIPLAMVEKKVKLGRTSCRRRSLRRGTCTRSRQNDPVYGQGLPNLP